MSRLRSDIITNRMANGAPTVANGLVISGVTTTSDVKVGTGITMDSTSGIVTATSFSGSGTSGNKLPVGTTAQRVNTIGSLRFNSTLGFAEYYNGNAWVAIDAPPIVSSVNTSNFESSALPSNIVITGSNFRSGATVNFVGSDGTETAAGSVTVNSSTQITAQIPNSLTSANEPYKIVVTNTSSGLSGSKSNAFNIDAAPAFSIAAGTLGTLVSGGSASGITTVTATDDEGDSITFSVTSGSLPSGITLNSNGTFSGSVGGVSSSSTSTFVVTASDGTNTSTRQYTITLNPAIVQLSGSGTFSVPAGINTAEILIVGGGASGARAPNVCGGGGGAGGIVYRASYTFTATDKSSGIAYSVGAGGDGVGISPSGFDGGYRNGGDTTFAISGGTITAKGGGGGAGYGGNSPHLSGFSAAYYAPSQGGSGGGGAWESGTGATSNQGTFSGWTSYGNSGGNRASGENYSGAGGGGAGGAGSNSTAATGGAGGVGQLFSSFTAYGESGYFGGGGAGGSNTTASASAGGNGGGGDGGYASNGSGGGTIYNGGNAIDGTGGGGGGSKNSGYNNFTYKSGDGGNGTILLKY